MCFGGSSLMGRRQATTDAAGPVRRSESKALDWTMGRDRLNVDGWCGWWLSTKHYFIGSCYMGFKETEQCLAKKKKKTVGVNEAILKWGKRAFLSTEKSQSLVTYWHRAGWSYHFRESCHGTSWVAPVFSASGDCTLPTSPPQPSHRAFTLNCHHHLSMDSHSDSTPMLTPLFHHSSPTIHRQVSPLS
jgi:hypothetical protein